MKTMTIAKLKKQYETVCNEYARKFANKQGLVFRRWVGEEIGRICEFDGGYYFSLFDITWDINSKQPNGFAINWHNECIENPKKSIGYFAYTKGLTFKDL